MFKYSRIIAIILCICIATSSAVFPVFASGNVNIDLKDLFEAKEETPDEGDGDSDNTDNGDNNTDSGDNTDNGNTDNGNTDSDNDGDNDGDNNDESDNNNASDSTNDSGTTDLGDTPTSPSNPSRPTTPSNPSTPDKDDEKQEQPVEYNSTFPDVNQTDWFYSYVTSLSKKGIIEGYDTGDFKPQGNITRAEFLKMLVLCMDYKTVSKTVFDDVNDAQKMWYYSVIATAAENGLISVEEYGKQIKPNELITRTEVAKILVKALKTQTGVYQTPYKDTDDANIVALYGICLMQGSKDDKTGDRYFYPNTNITRAETSAVLTRLLEYRKSPEDFIKAKTAEYGITPIKKETDKALYNEIIHAGDTPAFLFTTNKKYTPENITKSFNTAKSNCPELFSLFDINVSPDGSSMEFISLSETLSIEKLIEMRTEASNKAAEISNALLNGHKYKSSLELAKAIHSYIVDSVEFYDDAGDEKYTAYGALIQGKAVCQGYSAAFNLIASKSGLECASLSNDNHMWNVALCDGEYFYFDCTYDDTSNAQHKFCGVDKAFTESIHGKFDLNLYWRQSALKD